MWQAPQEFPLVKVEQAILKFRIHSSSIKLGRNLSYVKTFTDISKISPEFCANLKWRLS